MEAQQILESKENLIEFLKERGLEEEKDYSDDEYEDGTYFKIDKRKLLVVYEVFEGEKIKEIKDHFLFDRGLSYCAIVLNHKIIFFRSFGETKHFIYSERTKNNPSKIDKLEKIGESLDALFQSKDISAQFYEAFKLKRNLLVQHIKNDIEPTEKYLIAQKIFDRFFFIYFLCHKGIIKFKDGRKISGENLFSRILLKEGNFLKNLKKLFHLFNSQEQDTLKIGEHEIVVPYLNGGLFRPDVLEQNLKISLKGTRWEEIFDFLNSYHWIIEDVKATEENEEKILTPEILGHVYERSVVEWEQKGFEEEAKEATKKITERKKKGVYYTPESITEYISNNTIVPYLLDKLENKYSSFEELIESKNKRDMKKAIKILDEIKVLDPACGSGAFLIKASEVIFGLKRRLNYELNRKKNFYDLKLDIITENIYGVDILAGAIEISKLRLWLWLISDYEESKDQINALPNIEYNLKVGNSLIGWLDEPLDQTILATPLTDKVDGIFTGLIAFSENEELEELKKSRKLLSGHNLKDYIIAYYLLHKIYRRAHGLKAENLRNILETIRQAIYSTVTPAFLNYINNQIKPNYDKKKPPITKAQLEKLQIFHWRIDFGHIILNGGFDVVIGNPPYFSGITLSKKEITIFGGLFGELWAARNDMSYYFVLRGLNIVRRKGYISYIFPRYYIKSHYAKCFRNYLKDNYKIIRIIDTENFQVFQDANILTSIIVFNKSNPTQNKLEFIRVKEWSKSCEELFNLIKNHSPLGSIEIVKLLQSELSNETWEFLSEKNRAIIEKIRRKSIPLREFCKIGKGMSTGFNKAYEITIDNIKKERLESEGIRRLLKNGDIRKYHINPKRGYVIYLQNINDIDKLPNIKKHLLNFKKQLSQRRNYEEAWYKYTTPRNVKIFEANSEKIVVPFMATENRFAIDTEGSIPTSGDVHAILINPNYKKYIRLFLAILNSSLIMAYHRNTTQLKRAGYIEFNKIQLEKLPIKIPQKPQKLITLVDKILAITKDSDYLENSKKQEKVKAIQKKIDLLVYKLYDLTPEEIRIVEEAVKE